MTGNDAKFPAVRFSYDEDDSLIEFVMKHKILYDLKDPEFKNNVKKDLTWKKAGEVLKKEEGECKKRWKSMRDHYKREKKEEKGTTGKAAKKKRAVSWERLQFLDTVEDERSSCTNILTPSSNEESTPFEQTGIVELHDYEEDVPPSQASEHSASRQQSPQRILTTNTAPLSQTGTSTPSPHGQDVAIRTPQSKTTKERGAVLKYLQERKADRAHFKRCLKDLARQSILQEKDDEIDLFFKTMAATVKKFRPNLATKTKASVFKIVTDMELQNQESPLPPTTGFTNIQYDENQSLYSSPSPWNTPHSSHSEASRTNYDIVYQALTTAIQNEDD